jgi:hypothetical protein
MAERVSTDPEALLARYKNDFAAYESFLQRDTQTPRDSQQRLALPSKAPPPQPHVDPNETILEMNPEVDDYDKDMESGDDLHNGAAETCDNDVSAAAAAAAAHGQEKNTVTPLPAAAARGDVSASPAARPPVPRTTSATSAAAVARAIAAHGGLDGPACDTQRSSSSSIHHHNGLPSSEGGRASGRVASSASRVLHDSHITAATRRRSSAGRLDEVDRFIEERLQSAGRYRSAASPDAMYIKSQAWALRRRQINDALRREQEDMEMSMCTFQPQLGPAAEAETEPNCLPPVEDQSPYAAAGVTVAEDPGVAQHLKRQEEARRRRREAQARLDGAGHSKWTGRTTVPHEFKLGGRIAEPIPSLRKPCLPTEGEMEPWLAGAHTAKPEYKPRIAFGTVLRTSATNNTSLSAPHHHRSSSNTAPFAEKGNGGNSGVMTGKRRPNAESMPQSDIHHPLIDAAPSQQPLQQRQQPNVDEGLTQSTAGYGPDANLDVRSRVEAAAGGDVTDITEMEKDAQDSQELVRRLSDQLAYKDAIIQEQMEDLDRLHRELEAVKETLQQIASLGSVRR